MTLRLFVVLITSLFLLACSEESGLPREFQDETQGEEKEESFPLTPTDAVAGIPFTYELPQIKTLKNPNVHIVRLPVWAQWDEDKQQIVGTPTHSDVSAYQPFEVRVSGELGGKSSHVPMKATLLFITQQQYEKTIKLIITTPPLITKLANIEMIYSKVS